MYITSHPPTHFTHTHIYTCIFFYSISYTWKAHRVEYWTSMKSCITRFMPRPPKKVKGVMRRHT